MQQSIVDPNQAFYLKNIKECLKSADHWGHTIYYNVCDGSKTVVEWGEVDYFIPLILIVGALVFVFLFLSMGIRILMDT